MTPVIEYRWSVLSTRPDTRRTAEILNSRRGFPHRRQAVLESLICMRSVYESLVAACRSARTVRRPLAFAGQLRGCYCDPLHMDQLLVALRTLSRVARPASDVDQKGPPIGGPIRWYAALDGAPYFNRGNTASRPRRSP